MYFELSGGQELQAYISRYRASFSRRLQKVPQEVKFNGISSRSGRQELQGSISRFGRGAKVIC